MAEYQWWLVIVGLIVGGSVVALLVMDTSRTDSDLGEDEQLAEASFIAANLGQEGRRADPETVDAVLRAHRAYLRLPPPDAIAAVEPGAEPGAEPGLDRVVEARGSAADRHPDGEADDVGHRRRRGADRDLPPA